MEGSGEIGMRTTRRTIAASVMMMAATVGTVTATPAGAAANSKVTGTVVGSAPYTSGTFAIMTDRGQVSGTASGIISDPGVDLFLPLSFSFDLVVVDASPGLARRGSTLHFTGTWTPQGMGGPISGTIAA